MLNRILAAAIVTAAALAGTAAAQTPPAPVSSEDFRLVIKDVSILDAGGATLREHHCRWTEPREEDRPCLAFSGDPQAAYRAIQRAGGSSATVATRVPDLEIDTRTTIGERSDGTWLFRTEGTIDGRRHYAGYVCSADGRTCSPYAANSRKRAQRAIRAASTRVKRRAG